MDFGKIQLAKCASLSTQNEAVFVSFKACEAVGVVGPPGRSRVTPARTAFVPSFTSTPRRFISCIFYRSRSLHSIAPHASNATADVTDKHYENLDDTD